MQTTAEIQNLLEKYLDDRMTQDELQRFKALLREDANHEVLGSLIDDVLEQQRYTEAPVLNKEELFRQLMQEAERRSMPRVQSVHRVHFLRTSWFRYAAAVVLLVGGAAIYWQLSRFSQQSPLPPLTRGISDITPGGNRAVLTVGDKKIDLSSDKTGIAVGATVTYTDGSMVLNDEALKQVQGDGKSGAQDDGALGGVRQMELRTPRGGQYQALLPDGSRVWLNAASNIKFPSKFTGNTREVQINGEAYLEIVKNTKQPFIVRTNKTTVEVLGTSFNVNAYEDEQAEKTTLIEGSVRVFPGNEPFVRARYAREQLSESERLRATLRNSGGVILKPGQQAEILAGVQDDKIQVIDNQSESAVAWKEGRFQFDNATTEEVMRQLSRWYNIEIIYKGEPRPQHFNGGISKTATLSKVIEMLEATGTFHTRIEGNRVVVMP